MWNLKYIYICKSCFLLYNCVSLCHNFRSECLYSYCETFFFHSVILLIPIRESNLLKLLFFVLYVARRMYNTYNLYCCWLSTYICIKHIDAMYNYTVIVRHWSVEKRVFLHVSARGDPTISRTWEIHGRNKMKCKKKGRSQFEVRLHSLTANRGSPLYGNILRATSGLVDSVSNVSS